MSNFIRNVYSGARMLRGTKDLNVKIAYLGRAWYPKGALKEVLPRVTLISCKHKDVICELIQMHKGDKENAILKIIE